MRALLDTHTIIWAKITPSVLPAMIARILGEQRNMLYVSAATAWEIATKVRVGKLDIAEQLERDFARIMEQDGYTLLSITPEQALRAGRLQAAHRDPFDRILAAQAIELDVPVLSKDAALDLLGVRRIWG